MKRVRRRGEGDEKEMEDGVGEKRRLEGVRKG